MEGMEKILLVSRRGRVQIEKQLTTLVPRGGGGRANREILNAPPHFEKQPASSRLAGILYVWAAFAVTPYLRWVSLNGGTARSIAETKKS